MTTTEDLLPIKHYTAIRAYLVNVHGSEGTSPITGAPLPRIPRADAMLIAGIFGASLTKAMINVVGDDHVYPSIVDDPARLFHDFEKRSMLAWVFGKPIGGDDFARNVQATSGAPLVPYYLASSFTLLPFNDRARDKARALMTRWDALYDRARAAVAAPSSSGLFMTLPEVTGYMSALYALVTEIPLAYFNWAPSAADEVYETAAAAATKTGEVVGDVAGGIAQGAANAINTVSEGFINTIGIVGAAAIVAFLVMRKYKVV